MSTKVQSQVDYKIEKTTKKTEIKKFIERFKGCAQDPGYSEEKIRKIREQSALEIDSKQEKEAKNWFDSL